VSGPAHPAGDLLRHAENGLAWPSDTASPDSGGAGAPPARVRTMHRRDPCADSLSALSALRIARA